MTIRYPEFGAIAGDTLGIAASVQSTYEIKEVRASVEERETVLLPQSGGLIGTLSLAGLTRGQKILTVTAIDIFDKSGSATQIFRHDAAPRLQVTFPLVGTVARPSAQIRATCSDDDPDGCRIIVRSSSANFECIGDVLASGIDSVNAVVNLSAYDGTELSLCFQVTDSIGQTTREQRVVYVDLSEALNELTTVSGCIVDVNQDNILYANSQSATTHKLSIFDRLHGTSIEIPLPANRIAGGPAYLTPVGAVFVTSRIGGSVADERVFEWNNGELEELGQANSTSSLLVSGNYAIWNTNATAISDRQRLLLRELQSRNTVIVSDSAGNTDNEVSDEGKVAFWGRDYDIHLYDNGVTTRLTNDNDNEIWNLHPSVDGNLAVYQKTSPCCPVQAFAIAMHDGAAETILTDRPGGEDYQVKNNWVAYTRLGNLFQAHVWLQTPAGDSRQLTYFGTSSRIENLNPNGEVTFSNNGRRYLADFSGKIQKISSEYMAQ